MDDAFHDLLCPCGCCGGHCRGRACRPAGGAGNARHCRRNPPLRARESKTSKQKESKKKNKQAKRGEDGFEFVHRQENAIGALSSVKGKVKGDPMAVHVV